MPPPGFFNGLLGFLLVLGACCKNVFAQQRDVALTTIRNGDWVFIPTLKDGQVESFVGLKDPSKIAGLNISTVWFRREANGDWSSWGWEEPDQSKPIATIAASLGLPAFTNAKWPIAPSPILASDPYQIVKGVNADDPLAVTIRTSPDPKTIVVALEEFGWQACWLKLWEYDCEATAVLNSWANAIVVSGDVPAKFPRAAAGELLASGCTTTKVQAALHCWVSDYWTAFDSGRRIYFDGRLLGITPGWEPFTSELIPAYLDAHPQVPASAFASAQGWSQLSADKKADFRSFTMTHTFATIIPWLTRPGSPTTPASPPVVTPAPTSGCDHAEFLRLLKLELQTQKPWSDAYDCLYEDEGWTDVILRCAQFDCDDFADTMGTCVLHRMQGLGYDVIGRNKKALIRCYHWYGYGTIGHTIYAIYYCGYWYIIDQDQVIGIVPGDPSSIPFDPSTNDWLRRYITDAAPGDDIRVIPDNEWEPSTRPFWEGPSWYDSWPEVDHVFACLRSAGLTDEQILALLQCAIPADRYSEIEHRILHPDPLPPPAPACPCGLRPID